MPHFFMTELLKNPGIAQEIIDAGKKEHGMIDYFQEEEKHKNKVYQLQGRLNAITERLSELPVEMDAAPNYQQMQKILCKLVDKVELLPEGM